MRPEQIAALDVMRPLARMSEDIGEDALDRFVELEAGIERAFEALQMEPVDAA